jgi:hypothetical protein
MEGINQMIANMKHILTLIKESMQSVQNQTKFYKDKNHTPHKFEMNDWVFLQVKP